MGDFKAVVGEGRDGEEVGSYGLGKRNDEEEMLLEFCKRKNMMVTNTWFEHNKRRRYMWKNSGDSARYQLDYILVRQRYSNSVKDSRGYPGADIDSDQNLVMAKIAVKLKRNVQRGRRIKKWKLESIEEKAVDFQTETLKELTSCNTDKENSVKED